MAVLQKQAPPLAELYESALIMLYQSALPARTRLIAHAVREIGNRLPFYIVGEETGTRLDYAQRVADIVSAFERDGLPTDGSLPTAPVTDAGEIPTAPPGHLFIPEISYRSFAELLRDHRLASQTRRRRAENMFESLEPESKNASRHVEPAIRRWMTVITWFIARVHDSGEVNDVHDGELDRRFAAFETVLGSLLGGFYPTLDELDKVLDEANS